MMVVTHLPFPPYLFTFPIWQKEPQDLFSLPEEIMKEVSGRLTIFFRYDIFFPSFFPFLQAR